MAASKRFELLCRFQPSPFQDAPIDLSGNSLYCLEEDNRIELSPLLTMGRFSRPINAQRPYLPLFLDL